MKKRLTIGLAAGAFMAAMLPGVASATPPTPPEGGCPTGGGWALAGVITAGYPINSPANGNFADQNGDLYGCVKSNPGRGGTTWKDNTNPLPEI